MPREITTHKLNGLNDAITVEALDGPGPGGASHHYRMTVPVAGERVCQDVNFHLGPLLETGPNGVSNEALLAVVVDRLRGFQSGQFSCRENAIALTKLEEAIHWLQHRTRERLARGVEGTSAK